MQTLQRGDVGHLKGRVIVHSSSYPLPVGPEQFFGAACSPRRQDLDTAVSQARLPFGPEGGQVECLVYHPPQDLQWMVPVFYVARLDMDDISNLERFLSYLRAPLAERLAPESPTSDPFRRADVLLAGTHYSRSLAFTAVQPAFEGYAHDFWAQWMRNPDPALLTLPRSYNEIPRGSLREYHVRAAVSPMEAARSLEEADALVTAVRAFRSLCDGLELQAQAKEILQIVTGPQSPTHARRRIDLLISEIVAIYNEEYEAAAKLRDQLKAPSQPGKQA